MGDDGTRNGSVNGALNGSVNGSEAAARHDDPAEQPPREQTGVRIGPFVFVGGWSAREGDPWAHRRGEPRWLALAWLTFVIVAATMTVLTVPSVGPPTPERLGFAVRTLGLVLAAGALVVWPMVRLCQAAPESFFRSLGADAMVIGSPMLALIAPVPVHRGWSNIAALLSSRSAEGAWAAAAVAAGWWLLVAGVLAWGWRGRHQLDRTIAMAGLIVVLAGAPVAAALVPAIIDAEVWIWLSPFTGIWLLLGPDPPMGWVWASIAPAAAGVALAVSASIGRGEPI